MDEKNKYTGQYGTVSLVLLFSLLATLGPMILWASQPQYQGPNGFIAALIMYGLVLFAWFPMLVTAFVTGLVAIIKDKGRKQGIATLSIIGGLFAITMVLASVATN